MTDFPEEIHADEMTERYLQDLKVSAWIHVPVTVEITVDEDADNRTIEDAIADALKSCVLVDAKFNVTADLPSAEVSDWEMK